MWEWGWGWALVSQLVLESVSLWEWLWAWAVLLALGCLWEPRCG